MDNLTPEQRSRTMSLIRSKDTRPELTIRQLLHARGLRFRKHVRGLPGQPDIVFVRARVIVFVDGDYWHGWRFPEWRDKLAPYWKEKIERNRRRDQRTFRRLRRQGWLVLRLWEHQVECAAELFTDRVEALVRQRMKERFGQRQFEAPAPPLADRL
jgi:DNA mismatch endonuclease, patch repair protein